MEKLTKDEACLILGLLQQLTSRANGGNLDPFYNGGGNQEGFKKIQDACGHIQYREREGMFPALISKLKDMKGQD